MEDELVARLKKIGILDETAVLDDVLDLTIEDILERRLQTIVFRKGLAKTIQQCRQLITHGHIAIGNQRVTTPSYVVTKDEESQITYSSRSSLANPSHPIRQATSVAGPTETGPARKQTEREK
jgi:small subunit ribosomal protein S4